MIQNPYFRTSLVAITESSCSIVQCCAGCSLCGGLVDQLSSGFFASSALPPVHAHAASSALLAPTAQPPVLAHNASSAIVAKIALPPVLTDAAATALLALIAGTAFDLSLTALRSAVRAL